MFSLICSGAVSSITIDRNIPLIFLQGRESEGENLMFTLPYFPINVGLIFVMSLLFILKKHVLKKKKKETQDYHRVKTLHRKLIISKLSKYEIQLCNPLRNM